MRVRGLAERAAGILRTVGLRATGRKAFRRTAEHPAAPGLAAFTLLELMIVVVILGILAAFVVPRIAGRPDEARVVKAKVEISNLEQALELYNLDNGTYPSTEQGLKALAEPPETGEIPSNWKQGGYLVKKRVPNDPWGNPYVYVSPGVQNSDSFDLSSLGKDGKEGGEGTAADITNWE
jgi:general secretion pathway protein G